MKKVYISGPMTGYTDYNRPAFYKAEQDLLDREFEVLNPAKVQLPPGATWEDYMKKDIAMMMEADALYMLPEWTLSRGALIEYKLAKKLGIEIMYAEGAEE